MQYAEASNMEIPLINYLIRGGFPGRFQNFSEEGTRTYLEDLESTIVVNDLIRRYRIRKSVVFKKLVNYVLRCNARIYSIRSIHSALLTDFPDLSIATVSQYLEYLKTAYVIDQIPQYSAKAKSELRYYGKIYGADACFNSLRIDDGRYDLDHNLENIVHNELLYMGYDLKVYSFDGKEIDFVASKGNKRFYIQVAYSVQDPKAYERETSAFNRMDNSDQKILITTDEIDYSTSAVRHLKLRDFLLLNESWSVSGFYIAMELSAFVKMKNMEMKKFFDNLAHHWDEDEVDEGIIARLIDAVDIREGDKILDIGCGTGVIENALYGRSKRKITAIDLSDRMISIAKAKLPDHDKYEFITGDILEADVGVEFDKAILFNCYPHILDTNKLKDRLWDLLIPGGDIAILHSLSRRALHKAHSNAPKEIYFEINSIDEEIKKFSDKFKFLKKEDNERFFYFVLRKK